jgi:hypothetical protein
MAIVVESSSKRNPAFENPVQNVALGKPTGTVSGNLLIALLGGSHSVVTPASGFTLIRSSSAGGSGVITDTYYKVAGGSEPADYTFTNSNTGAGNVYGVMLRISGFSANEPVHSSVAGPALNTDVPSGVAGITPSYAESLLIMFWGQNGGVTNDPSYTSEAIAVSNPTWIRQQSSSSGTIVGFACSTATRTAITATGGSSVTTNGGANTDHDLQMIIINPIQNATSTPAVVNVTVNIQAPAISQGQVVTIATPVNVTINIQAPSVSISPTWTNTSKPSTTWTNTAK